MFCMQLTRACSAAAPVGFACSHVVIHAWSAQFIVLKQLRIAPHAAFPEQAAPCVQHFDV